MSDKNYEDMSDFEVNKLVAFAVYSNLMGVDFTKSLKEKYSAEHGEVVIMYCGKVLDYCNNPEDSWSIIVENKIDLVYEGAFMMLWQASHTKHIDEYDVDVIGNNSNENPLRAACICFLKMCDQASPESGRG